MHLPRERELQARSSSDGGLLENLRSIPERQFFKHGQKISLSEGYQSVRPLSLSASVCPPFLSALQSWRKQRKSMKGREEEKPLDWGTGKSAVSPFLLQPLRAAERSFSVKQCSEFVITVVK